NFTVGQQGTYTLLVSNAGPSTSGTLSLTDTLPTGLTFVSASGTGWNFTGSGGSTFVASNTAGLGSGANSTITLIVSVGAAAAPGVTNVAVVTGSVSDPNTNNNTSS